MSENKQKPKEYKFSLDEFEEFALEVVKRNHRSHMEYIQLTHCNNEIGVVIHAICMKCKKMWDITNTNTW